VCNLLLPAGLTQLSYSRRTQGGNTVNAVPEAPEGSAAALAAMLQPDLPPAPPAAARIDKLRLDRRLMKVRRQGVACGVCMCVCVCLCVCGLSGLDVAGSG
jgi:hypothetical protein